MKCFSQKHLYKQNSIVYLQPQTSSLNSYENAGIVKL